MNETPLSDPPVRSGNRERRVDWLVLLLLTAGIWIVYWPAAGFQFINFDDPSYVVSNKHIQPGITWAGLKWVWSAVVTANWHPVTLMSHMLDCQIYGAHAGGHHLTNVLLHTVNSLLLFIWLDGVTRRRWAAFFVAALFAWHPLHVESVAWVAERKDVLSALFAMLAVMLYTGYARERTNAGRRGKVYYTMALVCFALGLMSKPMVVTLPFVLLLMDYWPLGRIADWKGKGFREVSLKRAMVEKIPFLVLAAASGVVTLWAQRSGGAIVTLGGLSPSERVAHAAQSVFMYMEKLIWPARLAVFYPYVKPETYVWGWLAGTALIILSGIALKLSKCPYAAVGWFWFLVMLAPVIGLVQVGSQEIADRYTYLPSIGIFLMAVFGVAELARRFPVGRAAAVSVGALALAGCLAVTGIQVRYWRNSGTLFRHALAVTKKNYIAYNNLGVYLLSQGHKEEAIPYYEEAVKWYPGFADAHANLAEVYSVTKQSKKALTECVIALKLDPDRDDMHYRLANELLGQGDMAGAIKNYEAELALNPDHGGAHYQLATLLIGRGETDAAIVQYREALRTKPDWLQAMNNLAWVLATTPDARCRDGKEAVKLAEQAVSLTRTNDAGNLDTLAAAYAENARFDDAIMAARRAAQLASSSSNAPMAAEIEGRLRLYEKSRPFHEPAPRN